MSTSWKRKTFALFLVSQALADDIRVCNQELDMQVEFSECDALGISRNGK